MRIFAAALAALIVCGQAWAAELRIVPGEGVVLNRANGRGYFDLVVHGIVFATDASERAELQFITIELLQGETVREQRRINVDEIVANTQGVAGAGFSEAVDAQVLSAGGLNTLFGRPTVLSGAATLDPSSALIAGPQYFALSAQPDAVRVTATYRNGRRTRTLAATAPVAAYASPIAHTAPVRGVWTQQALPTLQSHHRLNPSTEFATDFFRLNERGELLAGDPLNAENAFGYGEPVYASAAGVVVSVVADQTQDRAAMTRRPDETPQQAGQRIGGYMAGRLAQDFRRAAAGNLIVIRHEQDGVVEYSSYGHLAAGSVRVRVGERVEAGQEIGAVGDTGDSAAVHLHYQLNAGADPFTTRSLPMRFTDVRAAGGNTELGRIVVAGP